MAVFLIIGCGSKPTPRPATGPRSGPDLEPPPTKEVLGQESDLLKPFRFNRYEKGELHPTSNSPFPWS